MKIALVGPTGFIGSHVLEEASRRGHEVTAIGRNPNRAPELPGVTPRRTDILDLAQATAAFAGHDVVVSCFNVGHRPSPGQNVYMDTIDGVVNLIRATQASKVGRLLFVGGAGALYTERGVQIIDEFPELSRGKAEAAAFPAELTELTTPEYALWADITPAEAGSEHIRPLVHALRFFEHDDSWNWSFFSPPVGLHPGPRTGRYATGGNKVPMNGDKYAGLSMADAAIAIVDEAERNAHNHQHWTAYHSVDAAAR